MFSRSKLPLRFDKKRTKSSSKTTKGQEYFYSPYVEGIINLRGSVLPVIDQRRRFGMEEIERSDRQRIMVFNTLGTPTGFIVDSVSEVYKIADADIEQTPRVSYGGSNLISEVANLEKDKRIVLLLDVKKLLDTQESEQLTRLAA